MIYALLCLWIIAALYILKEYRTARLIIFLCIFSLLTSLLFFFLGSPDVAMAEAAIGAFVTIFFIICFEKYDELKVTDPPSREPRSKKLPQLKKYIAPLAFTALLAGLFFYFVPGGEPNTYLKDQYLTLFLYDVGGTNAVTAIYLGYRVYDTLFEALVLVVAVVAVSHVSYYSNTSVAVQQRKKTKPTLVEISIMRIISIVILLFGVYLILNGHLTAGGGFQGGLFIAAFFICRYLIHNIYDLPVAKIFKMEEFIFATSVLLAVFAIFLGVSNYLPIAYLPIFQSLYMIIMNLMIGMKVACGFIILFYRFVAIERS
ncbi:MAG: DUF4040 domain-containing protein [Oscillospiraceae bacterium]|nr:DUF4040 domain-containing protein [Oscillospiraceae bacterium]